MKKLLLLLLLPSLAWAQQVPQNYVFNPQATITVQKTPGAQSKQSTDKYGSSYAIILTPIPVNISGTPISVNTPTANWPISGNVGVLPTPINISGTPISVNTPTVPWPVVALTPAATPATAAAAWANAAIPFATIPAAYGTPSVSGLTNTNPLRFCRFRNATNQPVSVSTDGTNDNLPAVALSSSEWIDLASDGRDVRTSIVIKYSGSAPTSGSFYINCFN